MKIFADHVSIKGLMTLFKKFKRFIIKKTKTEYRQRTQIDILPKGPCNSQQIHEKLLDPISQIKVTASFPYLY